MVEKGRKRDRDIRDLNWYTFTIPSPAINVTYLWLKSARSGAPLTRPFINDVTAENFREKRDSDRVGKGKELKGIVRWIYLFLLFFASSLKKDGRGGEIDR